MPRYFLVRTGREAPSRRIEYEVTRLFRIEVPDRCDRFHTIAYFEHSRDRATSMDRAIVDQYRSVTSNDIVVCTPSTVRL
jgi:hypothetical protein